MPVIVDHHDPARFAFDFEASMNTGKLGESVCNTGEGNFQFMSHGDCGERVGRAMTAGKM
jgi:hypothetical protein